MRSDENSNGLPLGCWLPPFVSTVTKNGINVFERLGIVGFARPSVSC
jgi:hypothetical protein